MVFDFLNKKKKIREAEEQARIEEARKREEREREEREREEKNKKKQLQVYSEVYKLTREIPAAILEGRGKDWRCDLRSIAHEIRRCMNGFCVNEYAYIDGYNRHDPKYVCEYLDKKLAEMQTIVSEIEEGYSRITQIQKEVSKIKEKNPTMDGWVFQDFEISQAISWKDAVDERSSETSRKNIVARVKKDVDDFERFLKRVREFPISKMMNVEKYGGINQSYWNTIQGMARADVVKYIADCDQMIMEVTNKVNEYPSSYDYVGYLNSEEFTSNLLVDRFYTIDLEKIMRCIWFLAIEKPFSEEAFSKTCEIFMKIYRLPFGFDDRLNLYHADIRIARLYVKKSMGGEPAVHELVEEDEWRYIGPSGTIVSSLRWMEMYKTEHMVLQYALEHDRQMTGEMQERLRILNSGGENISKELGVKSSEDTIYFDVSVPTWRDDEYSGLFEELMFQNKVLTYSLAIRDDNRDLFIPKGINIPGADSIVKKIDSVFSEEYGNSVKFRSINCIAFSGGGEETMEGVLASPCECKQMSILMYIARIGKKLIIRFYTLFVPTGTDLAMQKRQALSLYKKLSPSVTMWESSLKDMMLMAVEQILNSSVQGNDAPAANPSSGIGNEPVF